MDGAGAAYVCGDTTSTDFPRQNAIQGTYGGDGDGFVAKLALAGDALTLVYSTYLGGSGEEEANGIAVDQQGAAYVTGSTDSADFPLVDPLPGLSWPGGFLTKINPEGTRLGLLHPAGHGWEGRGCGPQRSRLCGRKRRQQLRGDREEDSITVRLCHERTLLLGKYNATHHYFGLLELLALPRLLRVTLAVKPTLVAPMLLLGD